MIKSQAKSYWKIEVLDGFSVAFERYVRGDLTEAEITTILQRLACRNLNENEIISASLRRPARTALLEPVIGGPPSRGTRHTVFIQHDLTYMASCWRADELPSSFTPST
jgi:hypothetical protein